MLNESHQSSEFIKIIRRMLKEERKTANLLYRAKKLKNCADQPSRHDDKPA